MKQKTYRERLSSNKTRTSQIGASSKLKKRSFQNKRRTVSGKIPVSEPPPPNVGYSALFRILLGGTSINSKRYKQISKKCLTAPKN